MVAVSHFSAEVLVDGVSAKEHADDIEEEEYLDDNETWCLTKYVEVVSGKQFELRFAVDKLYKWRNENAIAADAIIDGRSVGGRFLDRRPLHHIHGISSTKKGQIQCHQEWPFIFGDIITGDVDPALLTDKHKQRYDNLGTIVVKFSRVTKGARIAGNMNPLVIGGEPVPEKALKGRAVGLTTIYGAPQVPTDGSASHTLLDKHPLAKVTLKYRTKSSLQSLMIIERTPSPPPLEERPVEDLTAEELRGLVRRQRTKIEANALLKKEELRVKRERSRSLTETGPLLKKTKGAQGQTIYQFDSDEDDAIEEVLPTTKDTAQEGVEVVSLLGEPE